MPRRTHGSIPSPGWWKRHKVSVKRFFSQLRRFGAAEFDPAEITFSHDVYLDQLLLGEAGQIEVVGPGLTIGFLRTGAFRVMYTQIDPRFTLKPKAQEHRA